MDTYIPNSSLVGLLKGIPTYPSIFGEGVCSEYAQELRVYLHTHGEHRRLSTKPYLHTPTPVNL